MESTSASFSSDATRQLHVLGHDGHSSCVNGTQVCVLKETHNVCFDGFLKSENCTGLKTEIALKLLCDFSHDALEWEFANQQFGRLLVATNLAKRHSARLETVRLFGIAGCDTLLERLLGESLARHLSTILNCNVLGTSHWIVFCSFVFCGEQ